VGTHSSSDAARLAAVFTGLLLVASVPVALAADASGLRSQAASLRASGASLEGRVQSATLELYALEAELGQARGALAEVTARQALVARERAAARKQLGIARSALSISETRLAELVRALYEQPGEADPLAILLGAGSLEEALTGLDSLSRAAGQNSRIIEQARAARKRLGALDTRLAAREAELAELAAAANARTRALADAKATRERFVASLRQQQGLNAARIASIEAEARSAEARTITIAAAAPPVATAVVEAAVADRFTPIVASGRTITVSATGYALRGRTATGIQTAPGVVAVDPSVIPLGTRMTIPGYGEGVAADTGGAVHGNIIDLWFPSTAQALQWGRRTVTITIH
jgi:3D (Asp-Asp-Asp) domain-containing protein/septal ring factor EnvC (AmiA/AmiB activator)